MRRANNSTRRAVAGVAVAILPIAACVWIIVPAHAVPAKAAAPAALTLSCPIKGSSNRTVDLSSGVAAWRASGITFDPGTSRAGTVAMASAPPYWKQVAIPGGRWIQPLNQPQAGGVNPAPHSFFIPFDVKKSPGEMRIMLKGKIVADEKFSVELLEAGPGNPSQGGANGDPPTPGSLGTQDIFDMDFVVGETSGSKTRARVATR